MKVYCSNCGGELERSQSYLNDKNKTKSGLVFCSLSCSTSYWHKKKRNENKEYHCEWCGKPEVTRKKLRCCSYECWQNLKKKQFLDNWLSGNYKGTKGRVKSKWIKDYLIEKQGEKCSKCGLNEINPISKTIPLEQHHKDGNKKNHSFENLELLCPNHHSLTETFGGLNKIKYE